MLTAARTTSRRLSATKNRLGVEYFSITHSRSFYDSTMISDRDLFSLAIFLGAASMVLILVYHFLELNATPSPSGLGTAR
ncbi:hypothetical protein CDD81_6129 [Ophiocordyceps australis]|uniref:Dolichyl-diphosphooligosaccharide--protein glycosyltransferase subunit 4 n=1 Tax=Ophiocordyceps australis TaxID=1399860 RepID=A0A2C5Y7P7_9HYPO|nr:hypothetical protein CDD81_6129 [Ophiocordyceps australis]